MNQSRQQNSPEGWDEEDSPFAGGQTTDAEQINRRRAELLAKFRETVSRDFLSIYLNPLFEKNIVTRMIRGLFAWGIAALLVWFLIYHVKPFVLRKL